MISKGAREKEKKIPFEAVLVMLFPPLERRAARVDLAGVLAAVAVFIPPFPAPMPLVVVFLGSVFDATGLLDTIL